MRKKLKEIVKLLPEGLTDTGIEEICRVVEEIINEEVGTHQTLLESRTASFLSTKIKELKEVALTEIVQENTGAKDINAFNQIKSIVATVSTGEEVASLREGYEKQIAKLEAEAVELGNTLTQSFEDNTGIKHLLDESVLLLSELQSDFDELEESFTDMELSDIAQIVNENSEGELLEKNSPKTVFNPMLTDEILELNESLNGANK